MSVRRPWTWLPTAVAAVAVAVSVTLAGAPRAAAQDLRPAPAVESVDATAPAETAPRVLTIEVAGVINPATAEHLESALARAERGRYEALLIRVDTPGGMLESTRRIVQALLEARVPVIAHVSPAGARAGSAGVFVVMAAHVAVMTEGTHIGAAHPVTAMGGDVEDAAGRHMAQKVLEDAAALARSIAEKRERNTEWADRAVRDSESVTAKEALELGVVDLLADGETALLAAVDGRRVALDGHEVVLRTADAGLDDHVMTVQQRTLSLLGDPNLAFLLVMLGVLGIMIELYNPGLIVPAVAGVLCLLLAAIGLGVLPVSAGALVLIVLAVGFLVAEAAVVSYGLLTLAGLVCLVTGALLLVDTDDPGFLLDPTVRVSPAVVLPTVTVVAAALAAMLLYVYRVHRRRGTTGSSGLVGEHGRARTAVDTAGGSIVVHGETWSARSERPLAAGVDVRVAGIEGLTLRVEPADDGAPSSGD